MKRGMKRAVSRHQTQSKNSAARQERAIEKHVRQEGRVEARTVVIVDEWGHPHCVGGFGDVG